MMPGELYDFYFEKLSLKQLRQQGMVIWEDWWARRVVFGVLWFGMLVLTVGLGVLALRSESVWMTVAAYLPGVLFALNSFRSKFGLVLIMDQKRKISRPLPYSIYLDWRLR